MKHPILLAALAAFAFACGGRSEIKTESGLIIKKTLVKPDSERPKKGDLVIVHYTGTLKSNGKKFDSSRDRNQPFGFVLGAGQVIKGWDEGFGILGVGEKAILTIPPALAYGDQAVGDSLIPANSTLVFDVELVEIARYKFEKTKTNPDGLAPKPNDGVSIIFTGKTSTGRPFNSPRYEEGKPYRFRIGTEQHAAFRALDTVVLNLKTGEKAKVRFTPNEAKFLQGEYVDIDIELLQIHDLSYVVPFMTTQKPKLTKDSIQIFSIKSGNGYQPSEKDTVTLHMSMFLENGTLLFSSYESGDSIVAPLIENVFPKGIVKAISTLKAGEKAKVILPYKLAYGEQGGGPIPPRSNIVYNIELLAAKKALPVPASNQLQFKQDRSK